MTEFQLLLKPTSYDCNSECKYCFYKRVSNIYQVKNPRMDESTLEDIIRKYLGYELEYSVFCWQGGEPTLMGIDFFNKIIDLQKKHGKSGQKVSNSLQTNGYLINDEWAEFLKKYNFLVGLSLDGTQKMHNTFRLLLNQKPTWEIVMNSLRILQEHQLEYNILCVLTKANIKKAKELYQFFKDNNCKFLQFIPALEYLNNNQILSFAPTAEEYGNFLCELFDEWKYDDYNDVSIRIFDQIFSTYLGTSQLSCPFDRTCSGYLVVEWNGDIYPCDFFVQNKYKLGNILEQDSFSPFLKIKNEQFSQLKQKMSSICMDCHWKNICNGGCLKDRYFYNNIDKNRTYYCIAYKKFFTYSYKWFKNMQIKIQRERNLPIKSIINKINRNDICPCGSGLKYKKCHGKNIN
ncbi:MAG: anaerobic sulfatase maturase [Candidatus Helarchaeota archaeon]